DLFKDIFKTFGPEFTQEKLDDVKASMLRANASAFETSQSLVGMLRAIELNNLPEDFVIRQEQVVKDVTLDEIKSLAEKYLNPDNMIFVVVGDAASQAKKLPGAKMIK
ncbi:MAG: insulinase family protein, partial [Bacteroidales bacterium]|nr:insulinase family protein [Bacteroidales bacterium]